MTQADPAKGYLEVSVTHKGLPVEYRIVYAKDRTALCDYCRKRGLLAVYEMVGTGGAIGDPLSGFTVCQRLQDVSEDGKRGVVHVLVTCQEKNEEFRTWAHEISHAVDFTTDFITAEHPGLTEKTKGELKATCAELLADTIRILTTGNLRTETPMSQFPCTLARVLRDAHSASLDKGE